MSRVHSADVVGSIPGELVERLEVAAEGSRELDCDIGIELGEWTPPKGATRVRPDLWRRADINHYQPHIPVTTSLDAALALAERVLGHCFWEMEHVAIISGQRRYYATLSPETPSADADAATPALALCIAILKARKALTPNSVGTSKASEQ